MPSGAIGAMRAAAAMAWMSLAPTRTARAPRLAPGQGRLADRETLTRAGLAQDRAALVLSLWAQTPARQCAIAARYASPGETADFAPSIKPAAPVGARAMWARLDAAGFNIAKQSETAAWLADRQAQAARNLRVLPAATVRQAAARRAA